jgi:hypothetical protein
MTLYRIYTEDKNRQAVEELTRKSFPSFTVFSGKGVWNGNSEPCLVIELILYPEDRGSVKSLSRQIAEMNRQDYILMTEVSIESNFLCLKK